MAAPVYWEDLFADWQIIEGGYTPDDAGAPANVGVNQRYNPDIDVAKADVDTLKERMHDKYFSPHKAWFDSNVDRPWMQRLGMRLAGNRPASFRKFKELEFDTPHEAAGWIRNEYIRVLAEQGKTLADEPGLQRRWDWSIGPEMGETMNNTPSMEKRPADTSQAQPQMLKPDEQIDTKRAEMGQALAMPTFTQVMTRRAKNNERRMALYDSLMGMNAPTPVEHIRDPYENRMAFVGAILRGKTQDALEHSSRVAQANAAIDRQNQSAASNFEMGQVQAEAQLLDQMDRALLENYDRYSRSTATSGGGGGRAASGGGGGSEPEGWFANPKFGAQGQLQQYGKVDLGATLPTDPANPHLDPTPEQVEQFNRKKAHYWLRYTKEGAEGIASIRAGLQGIDPQTGEKLGKKEAEAARQKAMQDLMGLPVRAEVPEFMMPYIIDQLQTEVGDLLPPVPSTGSQAAGGAQGRPEAAPRQKPKWMEEHLMDEGEGLWGVVEPFTREPRPTPPGVSSLRGEAQGRSLRVPGAGGRVSYKSREERERELGQTAEGRAKLRYQEYERAKADGTELATKMALQFDDPTQLEEMIGEGYQIAAEAARSQTRWLTSDEVSSVALSTASMIDSSVRQTLENGQPVSESLAGYLTGERANGDRHRLSRGKFNYRVRQLIDGKAEVDDATENFATMLRNIGPRRSGLILKQLWEQLDNSYIKYLNEGGPVKTPAYLLKPQNALEDDQVMDLLFGTNGVR